MPRVRIRLCIACKEKLGPQCRETTHARCRYGAPRFCKCGVEVARGRRSCDACKRAVRATYVRAYRKTPGGKSVTERVQAAWLAKHPEYERERAKIRYRADPRYRASVAAGGEKWDALNGDYYAVAAHKRRVLVKANGGSLTVAEWRVILLVWESSCAYCGAVGKMTMDHVIPVSRGGVHATTNVVPACKPCNSRKKARTGEEFMRDLREAS